MPVWARFGKPFNASKLFEVIAILIVALFVGLGFYFFHGPMLIDRVALNVFAPNTVIKILDLIMLGVLGVLLLSNGYRMFRAITGDLVQYLLPDQEGQKQSKGLRVRGIPLSIYVSEFK